MAPVHIPEVAGTMKACKDSGGWSNSADHAAAGYMVPVGVTIHGTDPTVQKVASLDETAQCLRARTPGNIDNSSTTVVMQPVAFAENTRAEVRLEGGDGTRTGALSTGGGKPGQGIPCVAYGIRTANTSSNGWGIQEEVTHTLDCAQGVAVAFSAKDYGADATCDMAPTLRAMGHAESHANGGGQMAVAYTTKLHNTASNNAGKVFEERSTCLDANSPPPALLTAMQVRRLTPVECERLQGFPDNWTLIPWRKKPASECPDGPRYKSLGNSWAVNCARWIGERIEAVETIVADQAELETA